MKISFHSYANKTNFHMKTFALSLAFIMRFTATRKWPIVVHHKKDHIKISQFTKFEVLLLDYNRVEGFQKSVKKK